MFIFEHTAHVSLWDYVSKHVHIKKSEWPGWINYPHLDNDTLKDANYCLACYYMLQHDTHKPSHRCDKCPLLWPDGHCAFGEFDGLFNKFRHAETDAAKSLIATAIRDLPIKADVVYR